MTEIDGERWCIVDPVASKTMRISGLKQREQTEKVIISTQTWHSLYAKSVDEYVCQGGLTSHRHSHAERPLANYEAFLGINQLACEE